MKVFHHTFFLHPNSLKIKTREALILRENQRLAEVSPLFPLSNERLNDCIEELRKNRAQSPSVRFALQSLKMPRVKKKVEKASLLFGSLEDSLQSIKTSTCYCHKVKVSHMKIDESIRYVNVLIQSFPTHRFRIDPNRSWTVSDALKWIDSVPSKSIEYLEEPVASFEDLMTFSRISSFPVAIDESLYEKSLEEILFLPSLRAIVLKPTLFGGYEDIENLKKKTGSIPIVLSSCYEGLVGIYCIQNIASYLNLEEPIGIDTYRFIKNNRIKSLAFLAENHV